MSSEMPPLAGRTAIVTGASRGIGRAIAIELGRRGANVVVAARTVRERPPWALGTIHDTVAAIEREGGRALAVQTDVRRQDEVDAMTAAALEAFGGIDVLVNNAGAFKMKAAASTTPREMQLVMDVNVVGSFACVASCLPHLRESRHAHIVNIAPPPRMEPYWAAGKLLHAVSKIALTVMTLGLAEELRAANIAVNALWPKSVIATIGTERIGGAALHKMARKPAIVGHAVAELVAAPTSRTGQCLLDEEVLRAAGIDFERYAVDASTPLLTNYFVDPDPPR